MTTDVRPVETAEQLLALRADTDFHDGALAVLSYPHGTPIGYIGYDNPKAMFGTAIIPGPGVSVEKGPAGDFQVRVQ